MSLQDVLKTLDTLMPEDKVTLDEIWRMGDFKKSTVGAIVRNLVNRGYIIDNREREKRVYQEERVKTILIRENSQATQQSGGSVGGSFQRIKMHRKPMTTHAPASVVHRHRR